VCNIFLPKHLKIIVKYFISPLLEDDKHVELH
jgi:hypothetical protein